MVGYDDANHWTSCTTKKQGASAKFPAAKVTTANFTWHKNPPPLPRPVYTHIATLQVKRMELDTISRQMFVLTVVAGHPLVVTLLLYAVVGVMPLLADMSGGTMLTVTALGLSTSVTADCVFTGGVKAHATLVSPTELQCVAPPVNISSSCEGEPLELSLQSWQVTTNRQPVRRVPTPSIVRLSPTWGYQVHPTSSHLLPTPHQPTPTFFNLRSCPYAHVHSSLLMPRALAHGHSLLCNPTDAAPG